MRDAISIVVPVYNSEGSLALLVERLARVLPTIARDHEVILVNDGSRDRSWSVIDELASRDAHVRGIDLMRNFGQHNALLAGVRAARHPVIVTMDDDLQHPPEEIPKLLEALDAGQDVVYGTPRTMQHGFLRNLASRFTKAALARAMRVETVVDINAFRAFRTHLRDAFTAYESPHVVLDVLLSWGTTRFAAVPVDHQPRTIGRSNYTVRKLFNQALLIMTGFSTGPLRLASSLGFFLTLFGMIVLAYVLARYAMAGGSVPGFPFLASIIAIFSGAQMFALGIIGEYLARMFHRSLERPVYVIRRAAGEP
jgi:glycosyltransferase involved in cell wall biosynthesis